jgi:hypothetical protein
LEICNGFNRLLKFLHQNREVSILVGIIVVALAILIFNFTRPQRSVAAYCKTYKQEKVQLGSNEDDTYLYGTSVFPNVSSNDPGYFIPAFDKLSAVAPSQIEPEVTAMRDIFVKMKKDPTDTVSLALNGLPAESTVTEWTQQHCGD